jgi:hypothetical protein
MPRSRRFLLRYACGVRPSTPRPHASNVFDACGIQSASGVYLPPQQQLAQLERRLRAVGEREHRSQIAVRVIRDYLDGTKRVSCRSCKPGFEPSLATAAGGGRSTLAGFLLHLGEFFTIPINSGSPGGSRRVSSGSNRHCAGYSSAAGLDQRHSPYTAIDTCHEELTG